MIRKALLLVVAVAFGLGLGIACNPVAPGASFAPTHPQELGPGRPQCVTCHGDETLAGAKKPYSAFNHTTEFVKDHRNLAGQDGNVCAVCHTQAFCSDCHSGKVLMRPDVKLGNRPDRESPHRGDYLALHRFDAQADPTRCFKCHGRANNEQCILCHK
jgi:hypothetical protein